MPVLALDHVNLRTADPERTIGFFRDVLQMRVGQPPVVRGRNAWIYDSNDQPVVHIGDAAANPPDADTAARGSGVVNHIALSCSDYDGTVERLQRLGIDFKDFSRPDGDVRQLFVRDPNDILFELNFRIG